MNAESALLEELRVAAAALGDRTRLGLLQCLRVRPYRVGELVDLLGLSQPLVSHHLAVLVAAGWARKEGLGKRCAYTLAPAEREPMVTLQRLLTSLASSGTSPVAPLPQGEVSPIEAPASVSATTRIPLEDYLL